VEVEKLSNKFYNDSIRIDSFRNQFSSAQKFPLDEILEVAPWLLNPDVKFTNAVISINVYGRMVWHSGTWQGGHWYDAIWLSGQWVDGVWVKGIWFGGTWIKGTWYDGCWENGEWLSGIMVVG